MLLVTSAESGGTGTTAGNTLLQAVGIRQLALGGGGSALGGDAYSMFYNPAGLADIPQKQISSIFSTGLSDDYHACVLYGMPVPSRQKSGFACGIFYLNGGKIEVNYVDGTSKNIVAQSDFLATFGWGGYNSTNISLGYNMKYLSTNLAEDYSTSAIAFDFGLQTKTKNEKLRFGIAAQNYGTSLKYRGEKESLPFLVRSGLSYNFSLSDDYSLLGVADSYYLVTENGLYNSAGIEYSIYEKYFLRGGCKFLPDRNNFTMGLGLVFGESFAMEWATEFSVLNNPHYLSFSMKF